MAHLTKEQRYQIKAYHDCNLSQEEIAIAINVSKSTISRELKQNHGTASEAIYISLDDLYFIGNSLFDFVQQFRNKGGRYLYI